MSQYSQTHASAEWQYKLTKMALSSPVVLAGLLAVLISMPKRSHAGESFFTAGTNIGFKTLNSYQAVIYAPFGSLSESGLILRGWTKAFQFSYKTDLPTANNVTITAKGLSVEGEVGWQFTFDQARIALFAGVVWRKHSLSPADPGSTLANSRFGFSASIDGEHKFTSDYGIMANANFLQSFNQFWVQAKPYMRFDDGWKVGIDVATGGGKDYNISRIGFFASDYEFFPWQGHRIFVGGETGVTFSFKDNKTTPYVGMNVGYLF